MWRYLPKITFIACLSLASPALSAGAIDPGEECLVSTTIYNDACLNADGTPSTILNPGATSGTGCGDTSEKALTRAKQVYRQFGCLTEGSEPSPGCCTYTQQSTQECLCK
jgi:hypothetical protein